MKSQLLIYVGSDEQSLWENAALNNTLGLPAIETPVTKKVYHLLLKKNCLYEKALLNNTTLNLSESSGRVIEECGEAHCKM